MIEAPSRRGILARLREFAAAREGNFAVTAAILTPVIMSAAILAVDISHSMVMRQRMQAAADAAALATATRLAEGGLSDILLAEQHSEEFFSGVIANESNSHAGFTVVPDATVTTAIRDGQTYWQVRVSAQGAQQLTPMAHLLGHETIDIAIDSQTESAAGGSSGGRTVISMALVLDKSGSMGWYGMTQKEVSDGRPKKIDALKMAVGTMTQEIQASDPDAQYVRTGATAYDSEQRGSVNIAWGTQSVKAFVDKLKAGGGTASSGAFQWALLKLKGTTEDTAHQLVNGGTPEKFIVFMTDGANNYWWDDYYTKSYCSEAKKLGIKIYAVAFMAPPEGQALLENCASGADYYFKAEDAAQLVKAFQDIGKGATRKIARLVK